MRESTPQSRRIRFNVHWLGWCIAALATSTTFFLATELQHRLEIEAELRSSTALLAEHRGTIPKDGRPLVLLTGDSRAAQLGEEPIGEFTVVNLGVPGQISTEVLARIGRDMAVLRPKHVVVIAGVNDLKHGLKTPEQLSAIARSFNEMLLIGEAMEIPVTICPLWGASSKPSIRGLALPSGMGTQIQMLNELLDASRSERRAKTADISPLLDDRGLVKPELSADALHLNAAGQEVLRKLLLESLDSNDGSDSD